MSEPTQGEKIVKKVIPVRCRNSSKLKTKPSLLQDEDPSPPCDPHPYNGDPQPPQEELLTTGQSHAAFSDSVYLLASVIFQNHHQEKPASRQLVKYGKERGLLLPHVEEEMRRPAYELAFNALKYQELLEDIITDSGLFLSHLIPDDQMSLFAVMLYDFQDRKFLPQNHHKEMSIQEVRDVEDYLLRCKTKLEASLARYRIKHELSSIECVLPESVKVKQERSNRLLLYAWLNTLRSSLDEVQSVLKSAGLSQVGSMEQLEGQTFCQDPHCDDVLVFPAWMKATLDSTKLLHDHKLILQDKSCCLTPNAAISLLPDDGDVLMVGSFSGLTVSHTASLMKEKRKTSDKSKVLACVSHLTDAEIEALLQVFAHTGCKNVKLIPEVFQSLASGDKRLTKVRLILLTPNCSLSAVSNPLEFMLQENRDTNLLRDLSQGSVAQSKLDALIAQQRKDIDHALKLPKVSAVVYSTCSSHPEENEDLVTRAVKAAKATLQQGWQLKTPNLRQNQASSTSPDHAEGPQIKDSFFRLEPSGQSNGCFLALLIRESSQPESALKEPPQAVPADVHTKGKPDRMRSNQPIRKKPHGQTIKSSRATFSCGPPEHQISVKARPHLPQAKNPKLRIKASQNSAATSSSDCNQENSSSPITKPEKNPRAHVITPLFNTKTSTSSPRPTPPPVTPVGPAARPRRVHQLVLKPAVIILPPLHLLPPPHPRLHTWRAPAPTLPSSRFAGSFSKDTLLKHKLKCCV
ncbi:putative methyltransferase NSUN7 [Dunckerocampus dactyliophorus]|uniref:putative methyltransferase NSUN7 n=1 Tax=Dunckerocampus dactyliophorus TaxID=161453 RepID=UPI002405AE79|nr:putative methyltransferase NSUN7 [Dunckerocampus dactyliophorus]